MRGPTFPLRVQNVFNASSDVKVFLLVRPDGQSLPTYTPGAHISIATASRGGARVSRCYSLIDHVDGVPAAYRIAVRLDEQGSGGSFFMHHEVGIGSILEASPPENDFELDSGSHPRLFVAGGIGIAAIIAMAHRTAARDEPFELHYVARSLEVMPFRSELLVDFGDRVVLYFDEGVAGRALALADLLACHAKRGPVYVCGPTAMIDEAVLLATQIGYPPGALHVERFSEPVAPRPGDPRVKFMLPRSASTVAQ